MISLWDRFGWKRQTHWHGRVGCSVATPAFNYPPQRTGPNLIALSAAVLLAVAVSAFVPMGAVFPALAPEHTGAAVSAHSLAAGVATFSASSLAAAPLSLPPGWPALAPNCVRQRSRFPS